MSLFLTCGVGGSTSLKLMSEPGSPPTDGRGDGGVCGTAAGGLTPVRCVARLAVHVVSGERCCGRPLAVSSTHSATLSTFGPAAALQRPEPCQAVSSTKIGQETAWQAGDPPGGPNNHPALGDASVDKGADELLFPDTQRLPFKHTADSLEEPVGGVPK